MRHMHLIYLNKKSILFEVNNTCVQALLIFALCLIFLFKLTGDVFAQTSNNSESTDPWQIYVTSSYLKEYIEWKTFRKNGVIAVVLYKAQISNPMIIVFDQKTKRIVREIGFKNNSNMDSFNGLNLHPSEPWAIVTGVVSAYLVNLHSGESWRTEKARLSHDGKNVILDILSQSYLMDFGAFVALYKDTGSDQLPLGIINTNNLQKIDAIEIQKIVQTEYIQTDLDHYKSSSGDLINAGLKQGSFRLGFLDENGTPHAISESGIWRVSLKESYFIESIFNLKDINNIVLSRDKRRIFIVTPSEIICFDLRGVRIVWRTKHNFDLAKGYEKTILSISGRNRPKFAIDVSFSGIYEPLLNNAPNFFIKKS